MISLMRSLYNLSSRIGPAMWTRLDPDGYMLLEITDPEPVLRAGSESVMVPLGVDRSSDDTPNHLYDNVKFMFELGKKKGFWPQFESDLEAVGHGELLKAVRHFRDEILSKWHVQRLNPNGPSDKQYVMVHKVARGTKPPADLKLGKIPSAEVPEGAVLDGTWIVMTYKGKPIPSLPACMAWWNESFPRMIYDPFPGEPKDIDVLTGKTCSPNRTHPKIKGMAGTGGGTPLASHNQDTSCHEQQEKGLNFPMASMTMHRYASALNWLLDDGAGNSAAAVSQDVTLVFWPTEHGISHPGIQIACRLLAGFPKAEEAKELLDLLEHLGSVDTALDVAMFYGARSRITLLNHSTITVARLRDNLLQFWDESEGRFGSLKMLLQVNRGGKSPSIVPPHMSADIAWAVVHGKDMPSELARRINEVPYTPDDAKRRLVERAQEAWNNVCYRRKGLALMNTNTGNPVPAIIENLKNLPKSKACLYGRKVSCFVALKYKYHADNKNKSKAVDAATVLADARRSPLHWLGSHEASVGAQLYASRARQRKTYGAYGFEALYMDLTEQLGDWGPKSLTPKEASDMSLGWWVQTKFNMLKHDHNTWRAILGEDRVPLQEEDTESAKDSEGDDKE